MTSYSATMKLVDNLNVQTDYRWRRNLFFFSFNTFVRMFMSDISTADRLFWRKNMRKFSEIIKWHCQTVTILLTSFENLLT